MVYEFEVCIMRHHSGMDLILGTNFMIIAGISIDLFNVTARLPYKIVVPLLNKNRRERSTCARAETTSSEARLILNIESRLFEECKLRRKQPRASTYELWICQLLALVPTIMYNRKIHAIGVSMTNVSSVLSGALPNLIVRATCIVTT